MSAAFPEIVGRVIPAAGGGAGCNISPAYVAPASVITRMRLLTIFIRILLETNV